VLLTQRGRAASSAALGPVPPDVRRNLRRAGFALACCIVVLGVLGVLAIVQRPAFRHFDLDAEMTVPAAFSALLLVAASVAALVAARIAPRLRLAGAALSLLFAFMALDEAFSFHERLEDLTGVDWQVLYLPIVALGGVAYLGLLRRLRGRPWQVAGWLAGAAAWGVSQTLEHLEWTPSDTPVRLYNWMMVPEELLEMTGSALWALTLVAICSAARSSRGARTPSGSAPGPASQP
jgi:hypothetical protein